MIRALVLVLAILAGLKLFMQQRLYRQGAEEALMLAYRDRAIAACQSQIPEKVATTSSQPLWTRPSAVALAIGRKSAAVNIWDVKNELWPARFKHPHIVLTTSSNAICEYDVVEGRAYLPERTH
jgi:hypothetical protein